MALKVEVMYIGGVIRTLPVIGDTISVTNVINGVSTFKFTVQDNDGSFAGIMDGSRVWLKDGSNVLYSGFVMSSDEQSFVRGARDIDVDCICNSAILQADLVGQTAFEDVTVTKVVNYILGKMSASLNTVNIAHDEDLRIPALDYAFETGMDAMNKMVETFDGLWYIDADLNLFVFDKPSVPRGRNLSTSDVEGRPSVSYAGEDYINSVVFSNFYRSGDAITEVLEGDGGARSFELKKEVASVVSIVRKVSDGTNVRTQTFEKIDDETDYKTADWFYEVNSKAIVQAEDDSLPVFATETLTVTYKPLLKRYKKYVDSVETASYFSRNGILRGRTMLVDDFVVGDSAAEKLAKNVINSRKYSSMNLSITTSVSGYVQGSVIKVNLPEIDVIDADFFCNQVEVAEEEGNVVYKLSMNRSYLNSKWFDAFKNKSSARKGSGMSNGPSTTKTGGSVVRGDGGFGSGVGDGGVADVARKIFEKNMSGDDIGTVEIFFRKNT